MFYVSAGRIIGTHSGGARDQEPNNVPWHSANHGLVRGVVQVTLHAAGTDAERRRLMEIDIDGGKRTTVLQGRVSKHKQQDGASNTFASEGIVVEVTSAGLAPARITIPVSAESQHSVLETASRSVSMHTSSS